MLNATRVLSDDERRTHSAQQQQHTTHHDGDDDCQLTASTHLHHRYHLMEMTHTHLKQTDRIA